MTLTLQRPEIVAAFPHDPRAFTQGLCLAGGRLYESTGLEGLSTIREVRIEDGAVLRGVRLPAPVFGEGLVDWGDELVSLTWRSGVALRWERETLRCTATVPWPGEGWGLTRSESELIASNGTAELRFVDPETLEERRRLTVSEGGQPLGWLNDLAWVEDEILAHVFPTDHLARIDPATGEVRARVDLSELSREIGRGSEEQVPNGLAWDAAGRRLFVTGKLWPKLFEIRLP